MILSLHHLHCYTIGIVQQCNVNNVNDVNRKKGYTMLMWCRQCKQCTQERRFDIVQHCDVDDVNEVNWGKKVHNVNMMLIWYRTTLRYWRYCYNSDHWTHIALSTFLGTCTPLSAGIYHYLLLGWYSAPFQIKNRLKFSQFAS
jgi:hypothetical protein